MIIDSFLTIQLPVEGEYKEKGSKFLAYAFSMKEEDELAVVLQELKNIHPKARHLCYAYRLGVTQDRYRMNDDGEPSGTAGKPIYGQILSFGLTNIIVVVVRYFGGTKLGASGLIHAYKEAVQDALSKAEMGTEYIYEKYLITFSYENMGHIMNCIKECDIDILNKDFSELCSVKIGIRLSTVNEKLMNLKAKILCKNIEEINEDTKIEFCKMELLSEV